MKKFVFIFLIALTIINCSKKGEKTISIDSGEEIKISEDLSIYLVNSQDPAKDHWTAEVNKAILNELEKKGLKKGDNFKLIEGKLTQKADADKILKDIKQKNPSLIICSGDEALKLVGLKIDKIPVVFNNIKGSPEKYLVSPKIETTDAPGHNVTGIYRTAYFEESLSLLLQIKPSIESFIVLSDKSDLSQKFIKILKVQKEYLPVQYKHIMTSNNFNQWKNTIKSWQKKTDLIFIISYDSVTGASSAQIGDWISKNNKLPEIGGYKSQIEQGLLFSYADDAALQGKATVTYILDILKGTSPGELSLIAPGEGQPVINMKRAENLGIKFTEELIKSFETKAIIIK